MNTPNPNHARPSGQSAAGFARNITLPVEGRMYFPPEGTLIVPQESACLYYKVEKFGKAKFSMPRFEENETIRVYSKIPGSKRGLLIDADIAYVVHFPDEPSDERVKGYRQLVAFDGFITCDALDPLLQTVVSNRRCDRDAERKLSFGLIIFSFERVVLSCRDAESQTELSLQTIETFSMEQRDYGNLSALCHTGRVGKFNDGSETVFWSKRTPGRVLKIKNPK